MVKLFIGSILPTKIRDYELRREFEKYGRVKEACVLKNYGFVHMAHREDADRAIKHLNRKVLNGCQMAVMYSETTDYGKKDRGSSRDRWYRSKYREATRSRSRSHRRRKESDSKSHRRRSRSRDRRRSRSPSREHERKRSRSRSMSPHREARKQSISGSREPRRNNSRSRSFSGGSKRSR